MSARRISYLFASEKVRGLDLKVLLRKMLRIRSETIIQAFWPGWLYPKRGSADLFERIKGEIEAAGGGDS